MPQAGGGVAGWGGERDAAARDFKGGARVRVDFPRPSTTRAMTTTTAARRPPPRSTTAGSSVSSVTAPPRQSAPWPTTGRASSKCSTAETQTRPLFGGASSLTRLSTCCFVLVVNLYVYLGDPASYSQSKSYSTLVGDIYNGWFQPDEPGWLLLRWLIMLVLGALGTWLGVKIQQKLLRDKFKLVLFGYDNQRDPDRDPLARQDGAFFMVTAAVSMTWFVVRGAQDLRRVSDVGRRGGEAHPGQRHARLDLRRLQPGPRRTPHLRFGLVDPGGGVGSDAAGHRRPAGACLSGLRRHARRRAYRCAPQRRRRGGERGLKGAAVAPRGFVVVGAAAAQLDAALAGGGLAARRGRHVRLLLRHHGHSGRRQGVDRGRKFG
mmetsp:Transcript_16236/g.37633  ORF Transcript_16236/g.37633 Transcript_16236/m.37633 type:complete len:377 (+) Transcript_16236:208-1338(+)